MITGKYNAQKSWEKQSVFELSNSFTATVEYSQHYGEMVTRLDDSSGIVWHCSDGTKHLPSFAAPWLVGFKNPAIPKLVRPNFKKQF